MKREQKPDASGQTVKSRATVWLYPSTMEVMDATLSKDNCKSRSEFIERAIQFYAGYISGQEATAYLPAALVAALRGTVQSSEDRIARLLFKLTVEISMMMNVLAAGLEIDSSQLDALRGRCVQEVKKTSGTITFKDTLLKNQGGEP